MSTPAFDGRTILLLVGDAATGFVESTRSIRLAAKLTGWGPTPAAEWELRRPQSPPAAGGFELNGDAIAVLPKLGARNFLRRHFATARYARLYFPLVGKYRDPSQEGDPADKADKDESSANKCPSSTRERHPDCSPARTSPGRRARGCFYSKQASQDAERLNRTKAPPPWWPHTF